MKRNRDPRPTWYDSSANPRLTSEAYSRIPKSLILNLNPFSDWARRGWRLPSATACGEWDCKTACAHDNALPGRPRSAVLGFRDASIDAALLTAHAIDDPHHPRWNSAFRGPDGIRLSISCATVASFSGKASARRWRRPQSRPGSRPQDHAGLRETRPRHQRARLDAS